MHELNVNDVEKKSFDDDRDVLSIYQSNPCPAEILIPYNLSAPSSFFPVNFLQSRFKFSLWNMDSPAMMAIGVILILHLVSFFICLILGCVDVWFTKSAGFLLAVAPANVLLGMVPMYAGLVLLNLRLNRGANWQDALLGPTHIGLTDSGFKLWWRGKLFYNYPNLSLWSEIFAVDIFADEKYAAPCLEFTYQSGFGRRKILLSLLGLKNDDDTKLVLEYFARYVPSENQSERFKSLAQSGFNNNLKLLNELEMANMQIL